MSIHEDLSKHPGSVPLFGFPVIPRFKDGVIIWEFPMGYTPDMGYTPKESETHWVAKNLQEKFGGNILEVTNKIVKVKPDSEKIGYAIFKAFKQ